MMEEIIQKIENDLLVNNRCLQENTDYFVKKLLELWIEYDKELLEMIRQVKE